MKALNINGQDVSYESMFYVCLGITGIIGLCCVMVYMYQKCKKGPELATNWYKFWRKAEKINAEVRKQEMKRDIKQEVQEELNRQFDEFNDTLQTSL